VDDDADLQSILEKFRKFMGKYVFMNLTNGRIAYGRVTDVDRVYLSYVSKGDIEGMVRLDTIAAINVDKNPRVLTNTGANQVMDDRIGSKVAHRVLERLAPNTGVRIKEHEANEEDGTQAFVSAVTIITPASITVNGDGDTYEEAIEALALNAVGAFGAHLARSQAAYDDASDLVHLAPSQRATAKPTVMDVLNRVGNETWDEWWESLTVERRNDWTRRMLEGKSAPSVPTVESLERVTDEVWALWTSNVSPEKRAALIKLLTPRDAQPERRAAIAAPVAAAQPTPSQADAGSTPAPLPPHQSQAPKPEDLFKKAREEQTPYATLCKWIGQAKTEHQFSQLEAKYAQVRVGYSEEQRQEVARLLKLHRERNGLPPF